jgi:hypothetical protein
MHGLIWLIEINVFDGWIWESYLVIDGFVLIYINLYGGVVMCNMFEQCSLLFN